MFSTVAGRAKEFVVSGTTHELRDVTDQTEVFFRSMRLNRALNVWNVEVTVANLGDESLPAPIVVLVDSHAGNSAPLEPDGLDDSQPGKPFYDMTGYVSGSSLQANRASTARTISIAFSNVSPDLDVRVFAGQARPPVTLAVARSLDGLGQPLTDVDLTIDGPVGRELRKTDSVYGVASVGQDEGEHLMLFEKEGFLPVWRSVVLSESEVSVVASPRLTKRSQTAWAVNAMGGQTITNKNGSIEVVLRPQSVSQSSEIFLTPLDGQSLPSLLPRGWSPLQAFWIETSGEPFGVVDARLTPWGSIESSEQAALVKWNTTSLLWETVRLANGAGVAAVAVPLDGEGAYALVVPDAGVLAPPAAEVGAPLSESSAVLPDLAGLSATGEVNPMSSPASIVPEMVTGTATLEVRHDAERLPSGTLLRGEVTETYVLADGSLRLTPQYENFIVGYQRPGDADDYSLHATFPIRPLLLFGSDQLDEATVKVDILANTGFDGNVLDVEGGLVNADGVRVVVGDGQLNKPSAFRLRRIDGEVFSGQLNENQSVVAAFDLTVDRSTLNSPLRLEITGAPAENRFVLARVLSTSGLYGLQPVERLISDVDGNLASFEPGTGERLPGLEGSGQFVLIQVPDPQGIVSGIAVNASDEMRAGMPVRVSGQPWVTLTAEDGSFQLVAPVGDVEVGVTDPDTGDTGFANIAVTDPGTPVNQDIATAPGGPRVVTISPSDEATRTARVLSVVIGFNEAVNPATVVGGAIALIAPDDSVVPASFSLNLKSTIATLSPANELEPGTTYRVLLADTIADPGGLLIEGQKEFSFTTAPLSSRVTTAQLVIYEPGAMNVPTEILDDIPAYEPGDDPFAIVVHGQPGVADPEIAVVLANESTGETTTVLSKPDGSFSNVITGTEEDFVSATFINLNGTRVYVPVSRQEFDDGFVGLYQQGGILEAESDGGPVQVIIQPEAVKTRTKFRINNISVADVLRETGGVAPDVATIAGGGMRVEVEGETPTAPMEFSFPVDLAQLGYPEEFAPEEAAVALAVVRDLQGVSSYQVVDQMLFEPDLGFGPRSLGGGRIVAAGDGSITAGVIHTVAGFTPGAIQLAPLFFDFVVVPLVLGAKPVVVSGFTRQAIADPEGTVGGQAALDRNAQPLQGAFVILRNTPPIGPPGRLQSGMVYATSGADGGYTLVVPSANAGYVLTASHPRFKGRQNVPVIPYLDISWSGFIKKDFIFRELNGTDAPLRVNVAHVPLFPATEVDCHLQVSAFRGFGVPPEILVTVQEVKSLVSGVEARFSDVEISEPMISNNGVTTRWEGVVRATASVRAVLKLTIDGVVNRYAIDFAGSPPEPEESDLPIPDMHDVHGPVVISTDPVEGGYVGADGMISVVFNKPIAKTFEENTGGILLSGAGLLVQPSLSLGEDHRTLVLKSSDFMPNETYSLSLSGTSIQDLAGQHLDQKPSTEEADAFQLEFKAPPVRRADLAGMINGRGSAIRGERLYALDYAENTGWLRVYDIRDPGKPELKSSRSLIGQPRDLVVIPNYAYKVSRNGAAVTNDLVAVVGGDLDTVYDLVGNGQGNIRGRGQYLTVFNMKDPVAPEIVVSPILTFRTGSTVTKVEWSAPNLIYQEYGADIQQLGLINLQEMIIGFNSSAAELSAFQPFEGKDGNGDGDYVDTEDIVPWPENPPDEFFGKRLGYVLQGTTQKILDFSPINGGQFIGITMRSGLRLNADGRPFGTPFRPSYRSLALNLDITQPDDALLQIGTNAYPRWVSVFPALPVEIDDEITQRSLALVSLQPDDDGMQKLAVIDVSLPRSPVLLNKVALPEELLGGSVQSVRQRSDGLLEVAGKFDRLLVDSTLLTVTNAYPDRPHPSILSRIAGAGAGVRSLGSTDFGLLAATDGANNALVQIAPQIRFVSFPEVDSVIDPRTLREDEEMAREVVGLLRVAPAIPPARAKSKGSIMSDLKPPNPKAHFHVLVEAPGAAGEYFELALESVDQAGRPFANLGVGYAPARALSELALDAIGYQARADCDPPLRSLTAWRLSDDPLSELYNYYLSRPFALVANETLTLAELQRFIADFDREILYSGAGIRASIDPMEVDNPVLSPFVATVDDAAKMIRPVASYTVPTLFNPYIMGENPPPPGGVTPMSGTYGMIAAHSGEVRTEAIDMSLPSPRMRIEIRRVLGNQDTYDGPFGAGWDFNYNQRLNPLDPLTFPPGLRMPIVFRGEEDDSEIAESRDILFHSGEGRMVHFRFISEELPPEYAQDPLVEMFNYRETVAEYFLPESRQGVFDLLVKHKDGRFERLTPGGMRFRYGASGRLETIIDRYPLNRHELEYDRGGHLIRIDDRSVKADRYLVFGYLRHESDPDFNFELDEVTDNEFLIGKIRMIRSFADDDVLFHYSDEGQLELREGVLVAGENGGFSGRSKTHYQYKDCRFVGIAVGENGDPLFAADTLSNSNEQPVALGGDGIGGRVGIVVPPETTSETLDNLSTSASRQDDSKVEYEFDKLGTLKSTKLTGDRVNSQADQRSNDDGLPTFVKSPEGSTETYVYDSDNPIFRSRGNLLSIDYDGGPRGGEAYQVTFNYDSRYNMPSGRHLNPNQFAYTYGLSPDGRSIISVTKDDDGVETSAYNDNGQVTATTLINGVEMSAEFDSMTGFTTVTRQGPHEVRRSYDGSHSSMLGLPSAISPPSGLPTNFKYNHNLQPTEITRGELRVLSAYDDQGRVVKSTKEVGEGKTVTEHTVYDRRGFVRSHRTEGIEVDGMATSVTHEFSPDGDMPRVGEVKHPNGTVQAFTYDGQGMVRKMTFGEYVEEYEVDLHGNVKEVKIGGEVVETTEFDGFDRPVRTTRVGAGGDEVEESTYFAGGELKTYKLMDPLFGEVLRQTYEEIDSLGRPVKMTTHGSLISPSYQYEYEPLKNTVIGPRFSSSMTWNNAGHRTGYSDPILTTRLTPNPNGLLEQMVREEQGRSFSSSYEYDDMDNRTSVSDDLGLRFKMNARADGSFLSITNARNNSTRMEYTALGELSRRVRDDGLDFRFERDEQRNLTYEGDPDAGFNYSFDSQYRMESKSLRDGTEITYGSFDPRSLPRQTTLPGGGTMEMDYDPQGRVTSQTVSYQGTTYEVAFDHDALGRVRRQAFGDGGAANSSEFDYDLSGVLAEARYMEDGHSFRVGYGYYSDGAPRTITYPSGITVTEVRDSTGRLTGVSDENGNIIRADGWMGNMNPSSIQLGGSLSVQARYDQRGRMTGARTVRSGEDRVVDHMRYAYDPSDNLVARQSLHRGGRTDGFGYDAGERTVRALMAGLPDDEGVVQNPFYERGYDYQSAGKDYLVRSPLTVSSTSTAIPFATSWSNHDDFLQPTIVDGFVRGDADPLGNVASAQLLVRPNNLGPASLMAADLTHNGLGALVKAERTDGVHVENFFQPDGLRYRRLTTQGGSVLEDRHFVYDGGGRMIEEYDRTVENWRLVGRYYYATGSSPVAADLYQNSTSSLERFYFLRDASRSVTGVSDQNGLIIERIAYDTFGQPSIELRDEESPVVQSVIVEADGSLLMTFSEPVVPALDDPGVGEGLVSISNMIDGIEVRSSADGEMIGGVASVVSRPSYPASSVVIFVPSAPLEGEISVTLAAGNIQDDWGNSNEEFSVDIEFRAGDGVVLFESDIITDTSPQQIARSSVGNSFLFHGEYFDYSTGLIYLRARFYDPFSGMFLEPDPLGYEDSVNLYAAFANNPVSRTDPTGLNAIIGLFSKAKTAFLQQRGLANLEIEAIGNVLARRAAREGQSITISIRKFQKYGEKGELLDHVDTAAFRRAAVSRGVIQKGAGAKAKNDIFASGVQTVKRSFQKTWGRLRATFSREKKIPITSDIDALHVEINGQFATVTEIRQLFKEINREYRHLHKMKFARMGKKAPPANPPFQHEAHAHLLHQLGNKVGSRLSTSKPPKGYVTIDDLAIIGHPQDAFVITATKMENGGSFFSVADLERVEINQILRRGEEDFLANRAQLVAEKLALGRLSPEEIVDSGLATVSQFPSSYDTFKNGEASLSLFRNGL